MQAPVALLAAFGVAAVAAVVLLALARRFQVVRQLSAPLFLAALASAGEVFRLLVVPHPEELGKYILWAWLFVPVALVLRLVALYFFDYHLKVRRAVTLPTMISGVATWAAYFVIGLVIFRVIFPETKLTALAAGGAVGSLVLGLALQPILTNFFAGLVIAAERPFRINDWIKIGDTEGRVTGITWRTTQLRTRNNDNLIIPNAKMAEDQLFNYYRPHPLHLERIRVGVDYKAPPYRVRRVLIDCVQGLDGVLDNPTPEVFLLSFDDSAITYELRIWVEDMATVPRIASDARSRIWEAFKQHGISIPYPIRTLELAPRGKRRPADEVPGGHLYVAEGPDRGRSFDFAAGAVVVGRSRSCAFLLTDPQTSKEHFKIEWDGRSFVASDLGSSYGTQVNGQALAAPQALADLDRISVGDTVVIFEQDV